MEPITFSFIVSGDEYQKMQFWCSNNIGEKKETWYCRNFSISEGGGLVTYRQFSIRYETDAVAFKLMWAS